MIHIFPPPATGAGAGNDAAGLSGAVWVDLVSPTAGEAATVERAFGVRLPSEADLSEIEATSRLRVTGDALVMSAPLNAGTSTDRWTMAPTGFILSERVCITIRFAELGAFSAVAERVRGGAECTPPTIFVALLEEVVDRTADLLERAAEEIAEASQSIFMDDRTHRKRLARDTNRLRNMMVRVGRATDRMSRVRYTFLSIGRMAAFTSDRCPAEIGEEIHERLDSIRKDIASLDEFETSLANRAQLLQDAATGFISIEQNDVVKVLTVASVAGVPPVLVVGIYGMNFHDMPELSWTWGYPFALALVVLSTVLPLIWFRWRDWI